MVRGLRDVEKSEQQFALVSATHGTRETADTDCRAAQ
jgi:hypothetical protein